LWSGTTGNYRQMVRPGLRVSVAELAAPLPLEAAWQELHAAGLGKVPGGASFAER
jgi:hypothetical protein